MMRKTKEKPLSADLFDYLKMFNHVVSVDEELAAQLPATEFELSFNQRGDIYVNHVPLQVNVKLRYEALVQR
jgi:hypothetical protein